MTKMEGWTCGSPEKIKYLTDEQVSRFFKAIETNPDIQARKRDLALFTLMLSYGLRTAEVPLIKMEHMNLSVRPAQIYITRVKRKASKPRLGRYPHRKPFGYLSVPKLIDGKWDKVPEQDPDRAPIIKRLFEYVLTTGESNKTELMRKAREMDLRSFTGKFLNSDQISDLLQNPFYHGTIRIKGKLYSNKGNYEPIISRADFDRVQEILGGKRVIRRGIDFRYKGLLTCHICGSSFLGDQQVKALKDGSKRIHHYYHCTNPKCQLYKAPYLKEAELDDAFGAAIEALDVDEKVYEEVKGQLEEGYNLLKEINRDKVKNLRKRLVELDAEEKFIIKQMPKATPLVLQAFQRNLEAVVTEHSEVTAQLESTETGEIAGAVEDIGEILEFYKALKEIYLQASLEKRRKLNSLLYRTVEVYREPTLLPTGGSEECLTADRFQFHWNQPFLDLAKNGFIKGMEMAKAGVPDPSEPQKTPEIKVGAPGGTRTPDPLLRRQLGCFLI